MSKYIKLEDALNCVNGYFLTGIHKAIESLPTIEVMEYPQVDGITPTLVTPKFSEEELKGCDKVDKRFSEDAISRANTIKLLKDNRNYINADPYPHDCACDLVEIAPSVVPTQTNANQCVERVGSVGRAEGEWLACTKEGLILNELARSLAEKWYGYKCSECGYIHKGNALRDFKFCPNCGAKMRGGKDD